MTDNDIQGYILGVEILIGLPVVGLVWLGWKGLVTGFVAGCIIKGYLYFK